MACNMNTNPHNTHHLLGEMERAIRARAEEREAQNIAALARKRDLYQRVQELGHQESDGPHLDAGTLEGALAFVASGQADQLRANKLGGASVSIRGGLGISGVAEKQDEGTLVAEPSSPTKRKSSQLGNATPPLLSPQKSGLGQLHKRRASASPEKFNTGQFEPLPLQTVVIKRPRLDDKSTSGLDVLATAALSSQYLPPRTSLPREDKQAGELDGQNGRKTAPLPGPRHGRKRFSVFTALLRHNDILVHLIGFLTTPCLTALYAISKPFHHIMNRHFTTFILSSMRHWSPGSNVVFPWRCYRSLCTLDPMKRFHDAGSVRDVPSIRWLKMVTWRHSVSMDIVVQLGIAGHKCPRGMVDAIKRVWFLMDLPINPPRVALIHNTTFFSDKTLYLLTHLFIKLDMFFTDPIAPVHPVNSSDPMLYPPDLGSTVDLGIPLRQTLLAERSLVPLWRVLHGWSWDNEEEWGLPLTRLDMLSLWVRHYYRRPPDQPRYIREMDIMGIWPKDIGTAGAERVQVPILGVRVKAPVNPLPQAPVQPAHPVPADPPNPVRNPNKRRRERLLRPDELVMREAIRRELSLHKHWTGMMAWGFVDKNGNDIPVPTEEDLIRELKGMDMMKRPDEQAGDVLGKRKGEQDATDAADDDDQRSMEMTDEENEMIMM